MKVTISEPTPLPEMPVMWAVAYFNHGTWLLQRSTIKAEMERWHADHPGSRLITIDPSAPSFEPGPLEWTDSKEYRFTIVKEVTFLKISEMRPSTHGGQGPITIWLPNTRTDIGHLIRALVTKWYEAPEGT